HDPAVNLPIGHREQSLEALELIAVKVSQVVLGKGRKDQVELLKAAPLRPKQGLLAPDLDVLAHGGALTRPPFRPHMLFEESTFSACTGKVQFATDEAGDSQPPVCGCSRADGGRAENCKADGESAWRPLAADSRSGFPSPGRSDRPTLSAEAECGRAR